MSRTLLSGIRTVSLILQSNPTVVASVLGGEQTVVKQLAKELLIDSTSVLVREAAKAALWKLANGGNGGNGGAVCDNPEAHRVIYTLMEVRRRVINRLFSGVTRCC